MPNFSPELVATMRNVLEDVMARIPFDQATPAAKARMAEFILKAAADGHTSYDSLIAAAQAAIQSILPM
jgi:hypothetical protein